MASVDEEWTPGRGEDFLNLRLELTPPAGGFDDDDDDESDLDEDSIHSDTPTEEAEEQDVRGGARGGRGHGDACASEDRRVRPSTVEEEKDGLDDDDEDLGPDERLTDETAELFRSKTPLDLTRLTASLPSSFDPSAVPASYETLHKVSYPVLSLSLQPQPQLQTSNFKLRLRLSTGRTGRTPRRKRTTCVD